MKIQDLFDKTKSVIRSLTFLFSCFWFDYIFMLFSAFYSLLLLFYNNLIGMCIESNFDSFSVHIT